MKISIKNIFPLITVLLVLMVNTTNAASLPEFKVVSIKTSAICNSCKKRIETAVLKIDGVEDALLNTKTKILKVRYNTDKTNADAIRLVISNTGYDADDVKRNEDAYKQLPDCCQRDVPGMKH